MFCLVIKGLRYQGETTAQMDARERAMEEHNQREEARLAAEAAARIAPMPAMRAWAIAHGTYSESVPQRGSNPHPVLR
jgi:hypothetical protein